MFQVSCRTARQSIHDIARIPWSSLLPPLLSCDTHVNPCSICWPLFDEVGFAWVTLRHVALRIYCNNILLKCTLACFYRPDVLLAELILVLGHSAAVVMEPTHGGESSLKNWHGINFNMILFSVHYTGFQYSLNIPNLITAIREDEIPINVLVCGLVIGWRDVCICSNIQVAISSFLHSSQLFSSCAMVCSEDEYFEGYYMQRKITHSFSSTTLSPPSTVICLILYQIYAAFKEFMGLEMLPYSRETGSRTAWAVIFALQKKSQHVNGFSAIMYYQCPEKITGVMQYIWSEINLETLITGIDAVN